MGQMFEQILPALAVGGAVGQGVFGMRGARQQGRAAEYAASLNAAAAERESAAEASRLRTAGRRAMGTMRANAGKSGLQVAGSPLELLAANAAELERQAFATEQAGRYAAQVERSRGRVARDTARKTGAAALFEGGTRAAYYGRSLL